MSNQEETETKKRKSRSQKQQQEQVPKQRRSKRQQLPSLMLDITPIMGTPEAEYIQKMTSAMLHDQAKKQADRRYYRRVKTSDQIVAQIEEYLRRELESRNSDEKPPKMWVLIKNMLEALKIINPQSAVEAAEVARAIKNVYDPINPKIEEKSGDKMKNWVKSCFGTATRHGYEIHSVKIDKVERHFLHRTKEDIDAYGERKKQGIDDRFHALDRYIERTDKMLKEQKEKELKLTKVTADGSTITEDKEQGDQVETEEETE